MKKIVVQEKEVIIDEGILKISPQNLGEFLEKFPALYSFYSQMHNDVSFDYKKTENVLEQVYNKKYVQNKLERGYTDKVCEAAAKCDEEVVKIQQDLTNLDSYKVELYSFLKSLDYAYNCAKEMSYNLRKELSSYTYSS